MSSLEIASNTLSEQAFSCANAWLTDCLTNHPDCTTSGSKFKPHRLIDVGLPDDDDDDDDNDNGNDENGNSNSKKPRDPFLTSPTHPVPYACLSYVWGPDTTDVLRTTRANLSAHHTAIPYYDLPQTLRDAIAFCRGIKLRHLWVDALCIVQDDDADWLRQSAQMRLVYSNSRLTLAAHEPASCKRGFLGIQEFGRYTWQRAFRTRFGRPRGEAGAPLRKMYVRVGSAGKGRGKGKGEASAEAVSALQTRAWALQESILPTRLLHFTGGEMAWECNTRRVCECGHLEGVVGAGEPDHGGGGGPVHFLKATGRCGGFDVKNDPVRDGWMGVVSRYSHRQLSRGTDKLIALSGLVQMMEISELVRRIGSDDAVDDATGPQRQLLDGIGSCIGGMWRMLARDIDELVEIPGLAALLNGSVRPQSDGPELHEIPATYFAGIWQDGLPSHLLWNAQDRVHESGFVHARPERYRAPTWSWAAVDGPVEYDSALREREDSKIVVSECHCSPESPANLLGSITDGYLVVTGLLAPVQLATTECLYKRNSWDLTDNWRGHATYVRGEDLRSCEIALDVPGTVSLRAGDPGYDCWAQGRCAVEGCEDCHFEKSEAEFFCLRVAWYEASFRPALFYLVLKKSLTVEDAYERVGIGRLEMWEDSKEMVERRSRQEREGGVFRIDTDMPLFENVETTTIKIV